METHMNRNSRLAKSGFLLLLALVAGAAGAQSGGGRWRIDPVLVGGAGGTTSGGDFTLHGSFGQTATAVLHAPPFHLVGGFWAANAPASGDVIFANGFEENPSP